MLLKNKLDQAPFSFLPEKAKKNLLSLFSSETIKKDTILLVQEISSTEKLLILSQGSARYYFEQNNEKTLQGRLNEGDNFGGISILLNDAVAIRTLEVLENSVFLSLDAAIFLKTCAEFEEFKAFFTNAFGKLMLNKSYAGIIARQIKDKEFNLPFFNQPISAIFRPNIVTCPHDATINEAAQKMAKNSSGSIFIKDEKGKVDAIITDADLRSSAIAKGLDAGYPASAIVSSPLVSIPADSQVFEAFITMIGEDKKHLAVSSKTNDIIGTISDKDLITAQTNSTYLLIKKIKSAKNINQLENMHSKMTLMLLDPIRNGANPEYITRLITSFSDAILDKVIGFSIAKLGSPPCKFAFMIMGSEGREEQTLISDQDNAIIYEDLEDEKDRAYASAYFVRFSELVCNQLNTAGYKFCTGDNMAKNPKWCQSLLNWKKCFHNWIYNGSPEDLLNSSIFFDFKGAWGDLELTDKLKSFLLDSVNTRAGFLRHLTENALYFKPPIGLFGKLLVESKGEHKDSFDIKRALLPIVDFARVYSLKHGLVQTNTLTRLFRLYTKHVLTNTQYIDLIQSYNYLMHLRFLRQITTIIDEQKAPDNYINPKNLSYLDTAMLKEIFKKIEKLQQKLKVEFTGTA
ncbi:MAG: cyclic nucleotide-binding protein [Bacteroidetes bacterium]|nr:MAG: cyclic nucleotide-binding protein [Bacteroidota bacterium]